MFKWATDEEIARLSDSNPNITYDEFWDNYRLYFEDGRNSIKIFSIVLDKDVIGRIELGYDMKNRSGKFGIVIGNKKYWGKGIGNKSLNALFKYGFKKMNLNRIECEVYSFNYRSQNLMKSVGMTVDGVLREIEYIDQKYVDLIVYSILKREYINKEV